jgi:oligopeptidase B
MLAHVKPLESQVYQEIIGRLQQDDSTVPYLMNGYWYYKRFETGKEYPIYARRKGTKDAPEEILLERERDGQGHDFFEVGDIAISPTRSSWPGPKTRWVAGNTRCASWNSPIARCCPSTSATSRTTSPGLVTTRPSSTSRSIPRRCSATGAQGSIARRASADAHDPLVWEQKDESFYSQVYRTKDDKYLVIHTQSTVSSEAWFADAADPKLQFHVFLPRERDHEYQVEHANGQWIVRTNYQAKNFRIVAVKAGDEGNRAKWRDVVAHRDDAFVDAYDVSKRFLTIEEHSGGLRKLRVRPWSSARSRRCTTCSSPPTSPATPWRSM